MTIDLCPADDHEILDRLQTALADLSFVADDSWHDTPIGLGLTRFRRGTQELTVFRDAWLVDLAADEAVVEEVLAALQPR